MTEVTIGEEVIEEAIEMELEDLTVMSHQETAIVMTEVTNGDKVIMYYRKNEFNNGIFKTLKNIFNSKIFR